ncbi:hypothetical protein B0H13DRAFT_2282072 [Mycena leptocephala]|nr:hypothetical protein B0H13DRAFT_2282072 [Mycena leptocephala]
MRRRRFIHFHHQLAPPGLILFFSSTPTWHLLISPDMLLLLTVLTAVGSAVSLTVSDPGNILQSGGRTTIQWVTNSKHRPRRLQYRATQSHLCEEFCSISREMNFALIRAQNLVAVLAQHVGTVLYQYTIDLPPVPPSPAQQVWAKSRRSVLPRTQPLPLHCWRRPLKLSRKAPLPQDTQRRRYQQKGFNQRQLCRPNINHPRICDSDVQSSTSSSISKSLISPTSFMSATSLMSAPSTSPPSSHSAAQASTSRDVSLLLMGASSGSVFAALAKISNAKWPSGRMYLFRSHQMTSGGYARSSPAVKNRGRWVCRSR